jgi:ATP adenylyltransferase
MALDSLWAGWRAEYLAGTAGRPASGEADECLFCRLQRGPDDEMLVLERTATTFTVMNAFPYTNGHVMVAPLRHEGQLELLSPEEATALVTAQQRAVVAIKTAYRPDGLNVGANLGRAAGAGIPAHLHVHVVPRWTGDTNFMTSVGGIRVQPESMHASWSKLRDAWPGTEATDARR